MIKLTENKWIRTNRCDFCPKVRLYLSEVDYKRNVQIFNRLNSLKPFK